MSIQTNPLSTWQKIVLGGLMLNIGAFGCLTSRLWEKKGSEKADILLNISSRKFAAVALNGARIGILPERAEGSPYDDLATIYEFKASEYAAIKPEIRSVLVVENIELSIKSRKILDEQCALTIRLRNRSVIRPKFIGTTLTKRTGREAPFNDKRITFNRTIYGEKDSAGDLSWLWRIPLTPVAIAADVGSTAAVIGVGAAATPFLLLQDLVKKQ